MCTTEQQQPNGFDVEGKALQFNCISFLHLQQQLQQEHQQTQQQLYKFDVDGTALQLNSVLFLTLQRHQQSDVVFDVTVFTTTTTSNNVVDDVTK